MSGLHETNLSKSRIIAGYILSALPSMMLVFSGVMKLLQDDFMVENMRQLGLINVMVFIGLLEIVCVVLYWIPKTMNLGFFLLCSFVGGIIVGELISVSGQAWPVPGLPLAIVLYIGTFLRKPSLTGLGL